MIVGLIPWVRYVIFTDRVLEELPPDELDAVFGHEVGHARHGHIWYYAIFLLLSMATLIALFLAIDTVTERLAKQNPDAWYAQSPDPYTAWMLLPLGVLAAYIFVVFGHLSRRCERQADVFGCRTVSCGNPQCDGHDETTVYPPNGAGLCRTGILTFSRALERVGLINGTEAVFGRERRTAGGVVRAVLGWLRAWQHSTMALRVAFLMSLIDDPARERRFQRRLKLFRWALVVGLAAALAGLGTVVGWQELVDRGF
jgi:Zn-dependent protease with chaperone function